MFKDLLQINDNFRVFMVFSINLLFQTHTVSLPIVSLPVFKKLVFLLQTLFTQNIKYYICCGMNLLHSTSYVVLLKVLKYRKYFLSLTTLADIHKHVNFLNFVVKLQRHVNLQENQIFLLVISFLNKIYIYLFLYILIFYQKYFIAEKNLGKFRCFF